MAGQLRGVWARSLLGSIWAILITFQQSTADDGLAVVIEDSGVRAQAAEQALSAAASARGLHMKRQGRFRVLHDTKTPSTGMSDPASVAAAWEFCAELKRKGAARECEPLLRYSVRATPNDLYVDELYSLSRVGLFDAWNLTTGSSQVLVAVIDSGVQYSHPDLAANMRTDLGYDFINADSDPNDDNGHGTHCAGTIGAAGNNGTGVVGANWNVGIIPLKALDHEGSGSNAQIAAAVDWAVAKGAHIISMSLGGPHPSDVLLRAIQRASNANVLVVVAAGNEAQNLDVAPIYPAAFQVANMITVAATDSDDTIADFSNYSTTYVHVAAPGVDILSTYPGNEYAYLSGTSMATPLVAGIAALVKSANSGLSAGQLRQLLVTTAQGVPGLTGLVQSGARVNAYAAVAAAQGQPPSVVTPEPTPVATPLPQPTEVPDDGDDPDDEPVSSLLLEVEQAVFARLRRNITVAVGVYDAIDPEWYYSGVYVELYCVLPNGKTVVAAEAVSNRGGVARFRVNARRLVPRTAKKAICEAYAYPDDGSEEASTGIFSLRIR